MNRTRVVIIVLVVALAAGLGWYWSQGAHGVSKPPLHMLPWVGYDEPDYVAALERATGRKIQVQTYSGGEQMYDLLSKAPAGTYDVVVVDAEFGRKLFGEGKLIQLKDADWKFGDLLPPFAAGAPAAVDGKVFGAVARWGAVGLVYNTKVFSSQEVQSYSVLLSPKAKGKVGIFDWYLPTMGALSKALGNPQPYDLDQAKLAALKEELARLRPQVASIQADTGAVIDDLRTGRTAIVPGIGEWASAALQSAGLPVDYVVPKEGGIMWVEALAVPANAKDPAASEALVQAAMRPDVLALLASRKAYFSQLSRRSAYGLVPESVRKALKSPTPQAAEAIAASLQFRQLPSGGTSEADWLAAWSAFKAQ
jgi:spermidine/putrescine transport system substrate-binding protein